MSRPGFSGGPPTESASLAGLPLTELLGEVQERLGTAVRPEARVQRLLDAFLGVSTGLDLDVTLQSFVAAAVDLVDARYGALGVLRPGGGLAALFHVGLGEDLAATIGPLPRGTGLLGELMTTAAPLRVADLRGESRAVGFPPNHPVMTSFLGVPVLVRGTAFGDLYLADKRHGRFTDEDEAILTALAGAAGVAIDNARLYEDSQARRRWLAAVSDVRAALLDTSGNGGAERALALMVARVRELTGAAGAWLMTGPDSEGRYLVAAQSGEDLPDLLGRRLPGAALPLLAQVAATGTTVTVEGTSRAPDGSGTPFDRGPCVAVPLRGSEADDAVLLAARIPGAEPFDTSTASLLATFGVQASAALDMAARERLARRIDVYEDRDRIARDLHDHVIQRVFAAGLTLQAVLPRLAETDARRPIVGVIEQLDETIRDIRTSIFDLDDGALDEESLRRRLLDVVIDTAGESVQPTMRIAGAVDGLMPGDLVADLEAVVREGVSNAARHSGGTYVTVTLDVGDGVVVEVVDDGRGIDARSARSGLRNLEERARLRGGGTSVEARPGGGTLLRWWAPR